MRCDGESFFGDGTSRPQRSTLVFACFVGNLFSSLSHAMVKNEVLTYRFDDNTGETMANNDHLVKSRIRTNFPSSTRVPLWIIRNVSFDRQIEKLEFSLNSGEVRGVFEFNDSDRSVFKQFFLAGCAPDLSRLQN